MKSKLQSGRAWAHREGLPRGWRSWVLAGVLVGFLGLGCSADEGGASLFKASPMAPSLTESGIEALDHLGPTVVDKGTNFGVYSEHATRVELLLFDDPEATRATRQFEMARFGDVWNVYVEGIGNGQHYGFIAFGPNWPYVEDWIPGKIDGFLADVDADGNRFNPNKLLIDPYAKAIHRDHDWAQASLATGPSRTESTYGAASKSVVLVDDYVWSEAEAAYQARRRDPGSDHPDWHEQIIYEVHLKGFTADPASGVDHPGTFRGMAEKADYFAELGVTAVELLPVQEKPLDGGYWGYQTIQYFAPEFSYSSTRDARKITSEFKAMVDALHQRGIEVYIDVVYNHSGEGGLWREKLQSDDFDVDPTTSADLVNFDPKEVAGLYSFRGLDNQAYYALTDDKQNYWQATGVGNQMRCNHTPFRRLVIDSLRYFVEELHVDGFRFDLAPALGAEDLNYQAWDASGDTVLEDIINDPVLKAHRTRIIAEPWAAGGDYGWKLGGFPSEADGDGSVGWYEWNARFRDWWRSFLNEDEFKLNSLVGDADGGFTLTGSDRYFNWNGRRPYHSVNFLTVHDGFTLYDLFTYNQKQNGCGPLNPTCCEDEFSAWCDVDSGENHNRSRDWGSDNEPFKRQQMRNAFVAMMVAHGTPMILGGDEWMRTQLGNNNAYSTGADNPFNWFEWGKWQAADERVRMFDFVSKLTRFRKARVGKLSPTQYGEGAAFAWKSADNTDTPGWDGRHVMIHYYDDTAGPELLILVNMERGDVAFTLPEGRSWGRLIDTQAWFDDGYLAEADVDARRSHNITVDAPEMVGGSYTAVGSSLVVLEAQ